MTSRFRLPVAAMLVVIGTVSIGSAQERVALVPDQPLRRIAFGSCAHQARTQPIWDAVVAARPDVFLFLGDNIYADTKDMSKMRAKYAQLAAQAGFQALLRACPILATWDDHDYGADDAGAEYPAKKESQKLFLDFFGEPEGSPRRRTPGVYAARIIGPEGKRTQIILLDTRYFRGPLKVKPNHETKIAPSATGRGRRYEPEPDASVTVLGDAQWRWLARQLRKPAELRIIASSIQVVADDHDSESWSNFPHERQRLFRLIRDAGAAGVVFASGDIHRGELSVMDGGVGYPLFDLTSSGLNRGGTAFRFGWPNRHRVGTMAWGNNFGMIVVDWSGDDPTLRLQILDEAGDIAIQRKISLALLRPGTLPSDETRLRTDVNAAVRKRHEQLRDIRPSDSRSGE